MFRKMFYITSTIVCLVELVASLAGAEIGVWTPKNNGLWGGTVLALAISPDGGAIYAGTEDVGVFRSTNGGDDWTQINRGLTDLDDVTALSINPQNPDTIYAGGTWGMAGDVFRSTNGGDDWTQINSGLTNLGVRALAINPQNPSIIYAAGTLGRWDKGVVYRSTNGGDDWIEINEGLMTNHYVTALAINPKFPNPSIIYAGTYGSGVFAAEFLDAPAAALTAKAEEPVKLEWKLKAGDVLIYKAMTDTTLLAGMDEFRSKFEMLMTSIVTEVGKDGVMTGGDIIVIKLLQALANGEDVTSEMAEQVGFPQNRLRTWKMRPNGRKLEVIPEPEPISLSGVLFEQTWVILPEVPVKIGDSWTEERTEPFPATLTSTLVGRDMVNGYDCAKIKITVKVEKPTAIRELTTFFAVNEGLSVKIEVTMNVKQPLQKVQDEMQIELSKREKLEGEELEQAREELALIKAGQELIVKKKLDEAKAEFEKFLAHYPESRWRKGVEGEIARIDADKRMEEKRPPVPEARKAIPESAPIAPPAVKVKPLAKSGKGSLRGIAFSPDGKILAVASSIGIGLYDAESLKEIGLLEGPAFSVAFSSDGKLIASTGFQDGTVRIWDVEKREEIARLKGGGALSVAFSPDGKLIASGGTDGTIRIWDVEKREELAKLEGHRAPVFSVKFSPDGKLIASAGFQDGIVLIWDVEKRKKLARLANNGAVDSVAFSPDGKIIAFGGGGTVHIWNVEKVEEELVELEKYLEVYVVCVSVLFSPDGKLIVAPRDGGNAVLIWDVERREEIARLRGYGDPVESSFSVAFSPDGKLIAFGGNDGTVRIWDVEKRKELAKLEGYEGP
jgi:WD40 repeat protein